jgi:hypothetical protein
LAAALGDHSTLSDLARRMATFRWGGYSFDWSGQRPVFDLLHESGPRRIGPQFRRHGDVRQQAGFAGLTSDDIAGIQSIYGSQMRLTPRRPTAALAASLLSLGGGTSASVFADLTSMADVD